MTNKPATWQKALADVITDPNELCAELSLHPTTLISQSANKEFALRVPRAFVARMEKSNPQDPLLLQVLPIAQEMQISPGYSRDPLAEKQANPLPGLLHKYHGRVLIVVAGGCAIHCRYCFRRHFAYNENAPNPAGWDAVINYIARDKTIHEVIYSGGDPLLVKDENLAQLTQRIAAIDHVTTLRIHTRLPIVIPGRITDALIDCLTNTRLQPVVVLHCNHPNELDDTVFLAIQRLRHAGITLLNQSVLLKGINDDAEVLITLSKKLFNAGILPYYLHILDTVQGAAHFAVAVEQAQRLMAEVAARLPGYLVPKLAQERPGLPGKLHLPLL